MALRDQFWPCKIVFSLARSIFGLERSFLALRDRLWPCKKAHGLARSLNPNICDLLEQVPNLFVIVLKKFLKT